MSSRPLLVAAVAALALVVASLLAAPPADAARPLVTGFADPGYKGKGADFLLRKTAQARAGFVRININWRNHVKGVPDSPTNSADPKYRNFSIIDTAVKRATARDREVLLNIRSAPRFAEGKNRPRHAHPGTWKPRPDRLRQFATAVARRYSGTFADPGGGVLPRVTHFQAWNEWTSEVWLAPAWQGGKLFAPGHYRKMTRAFYTGVKSVHTDNVVVSGGTNPFGDSGKGSRIKPLKAYRSLFCLRRKGLRPRKGCDKPARFDAVDHHAINTSGGPRRGARHRDDVSSGDFRKIRRVVRAAERAGHVEPGGRRSLWVTESWFESKPPDPKRGVPLAKQARWIQLNLYVLWKQGARYVFNLQVRDTKIDRSRPAQTLQGGVLFASNKPKASFKAFRFPFVADRNGKRRVRIWGKAPRSGTLLVQKRRRSGGWRTVKRIEVSGNKTFSTKIPLRKGRKPHKLRGQIDGTKTTSLAWRQR